MVQTINQWEELVLIPLWSRWFRGLVNHITPASRLFDELTRSDTSAPRIICCPSYIFAPHTHTQHHTALTTERAAFAVFEWFDSERNDCNITSSGHTYDIVRMDDLHSLFFLQIHSPFNCESSICCVTSQNKALDCLPHLLLLKYFLFFTGSLFHLLQIG